MTMTTVTALNSVDKKTNCAASSGWLSYSCAITELFTDVGIAEDK